jgi:hypothetical protein
MYLGPAADSPNTLVCTRRTRVTDMTTTFGDETVSVPETGVRLRITRDAEVWFSRTLFPLDVVSPDGAARLELGSMGIVTMPGVGAAHPDAKLIGNLTWPRRPSPNEPDVFPCTAACPECGR